MASLEKITIVVATNNHFAILLGALIKSISLNHKTSEKIDLFIIDDGISESSKQKIIASSGTGLFTIFWFKTNEVIPPNVKIPIDKSAFPITAYLRLFAPYIIPQETERYIYLDVDTIVIADISELWHTNLNNKLFGAVTDRTKIFNSDWGGIKNYKELGFAPDTKYFNSGVLLVDPVKWREGDISNKVIKCIFDNIAFANYPDQYGLNVVLANQWEVLDAKWNCYSVIDMPRPGIVHFIEIKPIFKSYKSVPRYQEEFYRYLKLTPWKDHQPVGEYIRLFSKAYNKLVKILSNYSK